MSYRWDDADLIPTNVDVPIQRVKLDELVRLALLMGFSSVKINIPDRDFQAVGPFATILTEKVDILGKMLRFDGDSLRIQEACCLGSHVALFNSVLFMIGKLSLRMFKLNGIYCPLHLLPKAMREGWTEERFDAELAQCLGPVSHDDNMFLNGPIAREASLFEKIWQRHRRDYGDPTRQEVYTSRLDV